MLPLEDALAAFPRIDIAASQARRLANGADVRVQLPMLSLEDEKRMFVSMPVADAVAVLDLERFTVTNNLRAGDNPQRVVLQHDQKYLWVGNDSRKPNASGVTVIDSADLETVAFIATGAGHHEIAFSEGDRLAFVSNRDGGTVTVIDVQKLEKVADIATGEKPISIAFSSLGQALYVADGKDGSIAVIDPKSMAIRARIQAIALLPRIRHAITVLVLGQR